MSRTLYLSYDGMCDPLGASQVLPYLAGLAGKGHELTLISFEKPGRTAEERAEVARLCAAAGTEWHPLDYHKRPPVLSAMYDVRQMSRLAERLHRERPFDLLHCRSYLAALVGLRMKRRAGVAFLFDMRGLWADERVDGGLWNLKNPLFRSVYRYFKKREQEFLAEADHVISLTDAAKKLLLSWREDPDAGPPITVIPCCVDFDEFPPAAPSDRSAARALLGIGENLRVAAYLGSFGTWYMTEAMFDFFRVQLEREPNSLFLIVTRDPAQPIIASAKARGVPAGKLMVRPASRQEVPKFVAAADYGLFFIKPLFSKVASSPTKLGEFLALELPLVTNAGIGDVDQMIADTGAGVIVSGFDEVSYGAALDELVALKPDMTRWRAVARDRLGLDTGVERYDTIYKTALKCGQPLCPPMTSSSTRR